MERIIVHEELNLLNGAIKTPIVMLSVKINNILKENGFEGNSVFVHSNCYSTFIYFKMNWDPEYYKYNRLTLSW